MKKRIAAAGMAVVMAAMTCFPAQAAWISEKDDPQGRVWRYQSDVTGEFERNVLRPSAGTWWWIGDDTWLMTGHGGETVKTVINGETYTLTLNDAGRVDEECVSESGEVVELYDLLGPGFGSTNQVLINRWKDMESKDGTMRDWRYYDDHGVPCSPGIHEIPEGSGNFFRFTDLGGGKGIGVMEKDAWGHQDGYYLEPWDYNLVMNRWVPDGNSWYYFDEAGKMATGVQTIDGTEYDFGTDGRIPDRQLNFPEVVAVELGDYEKTAYVGDVVEIPFTVTVKEMVESSSNASPSNARKTQYVEVEKEADYGIFETLYAVGDNNRYSISWGRPEENPDVLGLADSPMDQRYEIDWDSQVIRVPVTRAGTVYGTLRIQGAEKSIYDKDGFVIQSFYPEDMAGEEQMGDMLEQLNNGTATTEEVVSSMKTMDKEILKETILKDGTIDGETTAQGMIKSLEFFHNENNKITTYVEVNEAVSSQLADSAVKVVGLGLSADANKKIGLHVNKANEKLPEEIADMRTAAFDLKVMMSGTNKKELDIPAVITMPKPRNIGSDDFGLYHIVEGTAEEVEYIYDGAKDTVSFAVDSFSTYVFAEEENGNTNTGNTGSSKPKGAGSGSGSGVWKPAETMVQGPGRSAEAKVWSGGQWLLDATGWWYRAADGTYPKNTWANIEWAGQKNWYHFNESGYMDTGWILDSANWYYLHAVADGSRGHMYTGWHEIGGKWYYFNMGSGLPLGAMLADTTTPDNYRVDEQGAWIQ